MTFNFKPLRPIYFRAIFYRFIKTVLLAVCLFSINGHAADKRPLRVVTEDYPPYEIASPLSALQGFDYEVATIVFDRMGFDMETEFLPWGRVISIAKNGRAAGILTCAYTEEREEFIIYSDPISSFTSGFFVRKGFDGPVPNALGDVEGYRVASAKGYESYQELLNAGLKPFAVNDTKSGIKALLLGRFDYLYLGQEPTEFLIKSMALTDGFEFYPLSTKSFYFCFSRNYPGVGPLVTKFNESLNALRASGIYEEIHAKYR